MKSAQKLIAAVSAASLYLSVATLTFAVSNNAVQGSNSTVKLCPEGSMFDTLCKTTSADPQTLLSRILNILLLLGAVAALIFLIIGGFKWITAGGDKTKVEAARNTIVGAIIGLVVVFLSFFVINFVFKLLTGNDIGSFTLPALLQ